MGRNVIMTARILSKTFSKNIVYKRNLSWSLHPIPTKMDMKGTSETITRFINEWNDKTKWMLIHNDIDVFAHSARNHTECLSEVGGSPILIWFFDHFSCLLDGKEPTKEWGPKPSRVSEFTHTYLILTMMLLAGREGANSLDRRSPVVWRRSPMKWTTLTLPYPSSVRQRCKSRDQLN